jgi:hypothetical protein
MEKKLKCKMSTFQTPLSFNEWVERYRVSSQYVEPTKYFTGYLGGTMNTRYEFAPEVSQDGDKFTGILNKLKTKIKWVEKIV